MKKTQMKKDIKPYKLAQIAAKFLNEQYASIDEAKKGGKYIVWTPASLKANLEARIENYGDSQPKMLKSFQTFEDAMAFIDNEFGGFALVDTFGAYDGELEDQVDIYPISGDPSFVSQMQKLGKVADDFNAEMNGEY